MQCNMILYILVCFHVQLLGFHFNIMQHNCQITCNCGNILVNEKKHYEVIIKNVN
jgi:hypothetical protein